MKATFPFILVLFLFLQSCYQESITFEQTDYELALILNLDGMSCSYDNRYSSLRYSLDPSLSDNYSPYVEFQKFSSVSFNGIELNNKQINDLGEIDYNTSYEVIINSDGQSKTFDLMFTDLPIIQIFTPNSIPNDYKVPAIMKINSSEYSSEYEYFIGIEYRGQTSYALPKRSMGFSIRKSTNFNERISASLFDLRVNNDWILDATYQDLSKVRASTSFEVWENICENSKMSIHSKFVELFINNEHQGLYCLRETFNAESFDIINTNSVVYKSISGTEGATRFRTYSDIVSRTYIWDGWEQIYPDAEIELNWEALKELRYLVAASDSTYFRTNISTLVDLNEYINFYLFLWVSYAHDCVHKNVFLLNEGEFFNFIPWDLDPTWGLWWSGDQVSYDYLFSENLFARLMELNPNNFKEQLTSRWFELRNSVLQEEEIKSIMTKYLNMLKTSNIIELDNEIWDTGLNLEEQETLMFTWLENRIAFLDNYFSGL